MECLEESGQKLKQIDATNKVSNNLLCISSFRFRDDDISQTHSVMSFIRNEELVHQQTKQTLETEEVQTVEDITLCNDQICEVQPQQLENDDFVTQIIIRPRLIDIQDESVFSTQKTSIDEVKTKDQEIVITSLIYNSPKSKVQKKSHQKGSNKDKSTHKNQVISLTQVNSPSNKSIPHRNHDFFSNNLPIKNRPSKEIKNFFQNDTKLTSMQQVCMHLKKDSCSTIRSDNFGKTNNSSYQGLSSLQHMRSTNNSITREKRLKSSQLIKEGKLNEALEEVNMLLQTETKNESTVNDNESADAYYIRGQIHEKKGLFQQALEDFNLALTLNPLHANAAFSKASCENKLGKFEESINTYTQALALDEEQQNSKLYLNSSSSYYQGNPIFVKKMNTMSNVETQKESDLKIHLKQIKSSDKFLKERQTSCSQQSQNDEIPFNSKFEILTPYSQEGSVNFRSHVKLEEEKSVKTLDKQVSKFGCVMINLDEFKKQTVKTMQSPSRHATQSKPHIFKRNNKLLFSPSSSITTVSSQMTKKVNLRIETLINNNKDAIKIDDKFQNFDSYLAHKTPYEILSSKRSKQGWKGPTQIHCQVNEAQKKIQKVKSHLSTQHSKKTMFQANQKQRENFHKKPSSQQLNTVKQQKTRKISNLDQNLISKLNFSNIQSNHCKTHKNEQILKNHQVLSKKQEKTNLGKVGLKQSKSRSPYRLTLPFLSKSKESTATRSQRFSSLSIERIIKTNNQRQSQSRSNSSRRITTQNNVSLLLKEIRQMIEADRPQYNKVFIKIQKLE